MPYKRRNTRRHRSRSNRRRRQFKGGASPPHGNLTDNIINTYIAPYIDSLKENPGTNIITLNGMYYNKPMEINLLYETDDDDNLVSVIVMRGGNREDPAIITGRDIVNYLKEYNRSEEITINNINFVISVWGKFLISII
jgi:hypothetical protein